MSKARLAAEFMSQLQRNADTQKLENSAMDTRVDTLTSDVDAVETSVAATPNAVAMSLIFGG